MGIATSAVIPSPQSEVFGWFSRPGAFERLSPPWQPLTLKSEAESLRDGHAVLSLPGGVQWVARHIAEEYDPPARFVDEVVFDGARTLPTGFFPWKHIHEFAAIDEGHTRVSDRVDTVVPARALRATFAYRTEQLTQDLASHARAASHGFSAKTIAITGASGLVGTALAAFLSSGGHTVIRLTRNAETAAGERYWDTEAPAGDLLAGVDAVVHLAGANIAGRFTDAHKRAIKASRLWPTEKLAELARRSGVPAFISASAIGLYGSDRGDEQLTEDSAPADDGGFLAQVVADWESAAGASGPGTRVVTVRTGIVQSPRGGTLKLLRPLFAAGLGGRLGSGKQWLSWIGVDDLVEVYHRALWDQSLAGPINAVAPHPVNNTDYTKVLARVLHRPAILPVPSFGPALLLGSEGVAELAEASQRVVPAKLLAAGHTFRYAELEPALRHLLGKA